MTPEQLVKRYLDPRCRWTAADEAQAKAIKADPEARRVWARAIAIHRAMVGATDLPSGIEQRRQLELALPRGPVAEPRWRQWWVPVASLVVALFIAVPGLMRPEAEWIRARGIAGSGLEPQVGLGVGGVTDDGREYEAIAGAMHVDDWLRFSYTNERSDLTWLYVFGLQRSGPIPIAPLPDEEQSLPIHVGRFVPLDFEARLGARHQLGPVRIVALFTATPMTTAQVDALVLDPSLVTALPSELEARLRADLSLPPEAVVRILDSHVRPGSATLPGARQETP